MRALSMAVFVAGCVTPPAIGRPPVIPVLFVYDPRGALVQTHDRRLHAPPNRDELAALVANLRI